MVRREQYQEGETLIRDAEEEEEEVELDSEDGAQSQMELQVPDTNGHFSQVVEMPSPMHSQARAHCYLVTASLMASLGGVLFGYDIGIISGAILQLRDVFCLSCLDQELVISAMLIGAVVGSLVGGYLIDFYGRRVTIIINAGIFLIGAFVLALAPNFPIVVVGRLLVGFAVSVSATGECIYISEIAPANRRGLLVSLNELGITLGLLLAYLCNFIFISMPNGWRWMFVLSAVPALIQGVGMFFLPASPRFLMLNKREKEAEQVLQALRGTNRVSRELSGIKVSIAAEKNQGCLNLCGSEDGMRGRMLVGVGLVFFQQFTGQPNVLYYAPTIFMEIGYHSDSAATLATVGLGLVKVLMTVVALIIVDKVGRRKLLFAGTIMMGISIFTLGIVCHFEASEAPQKVCVDHTNCHSPISHSHQFMLSTISTANTSSHNTSRYTNVTLHENGTAGSVMSIPLKPVTKVIPGVLANDSDISLNVTSGDKLKDTNTTSHGVFRKAAGFVALMCYVAAYGFSFGPVTWLVLSEIFPAAIKGRAIAVATVFNWGTNLIVTFTFLDVMNALGVTWTFTAFSIVCALAVIFIFSFVPETKNRTLEQVSADMRDKSLLKRMKINCSCCFSCQRSHSNYKMVQSETLT